MNVKAKINKPSEKVANIMLTEMAKSVSQEVEKDIPVSKLEGFKYKKQMVTKTKAVPQVQCVIKKANVNELETHYIYKQREKQYTHMSRYVFTAISPEETEITYYEELTPSTLNQNVVGWIYWNIFMKKNKVKKNLLKLNTVENE